MKDSVEWETISKVLYLHIKNDNNMLMLQNLSHLEPWLSPKLHDKLFKCTMMRMENEIKMGFF